MSQNRNILSLSQLLYNLDSELSPYVRSQTALLLSFWCTQSRSQSQDTATPWVAIAIEHAREIDAHRYDNASESGIIKPGPREQLLKRLWWACTIRDRLLPVGLRQDIHVSRANFDFDAMAPPAHVDYADEIGNSRVYSPGNKLMLVGLMIRLVELCVILTDLPNIMTHVDEPEYGDAGSYTKDLQKVTQLTRKLRSWFNTTQKQFPLTIHPRITTGPDRSQQESVVFHTHLVYMYYQ